MSIAFVTMVYNDLFFLDIWLRHYLRHSPPEHLYIVTHGPQPWVHEVAAGCNVIEIERDPRNPRLDQDRIAYLSEFCSGLTSRYDRVIMNDVDEIVVLDPAVGSNLVDYLGAKPVEQRVITPLGLEIVHRADLEGDYDYHRPLFAQRKFVRVNGWYTKPNIINCPIIWGPDGHGASYGDIHIDQYLYTFHLKWFDQNHHLRRHEERLSFRFHDENGNEVVIGAGSWSWSSQTYRLVTNSFLRHELVDSEDAFEFAPQRARITRSFTEGRTGMYKISWFVEGRLRELPERFVGLI